MNTQHLVLFTCLAETGHFGRAAALRHISPSTLSRTIQAMESELGVALFDRNNRHVSLTSHGQTFLNFARTQLKQWETLQESLINTQGQLTGSVSIYCSVTASYSFLYEILTSFRKEHPFIQIKLHTGDPADAIERVSSGREDISIAAKPDKLSSSLRFKQFDSSPLLFICAKHNSHFENLISHSGQAAWAKIPMIVSERGLARERFNQWTNAQGIQPTIYSQVSGNEAIVSMVSLDCGVGLVPKIVVDNSPLLSSVREFVIQPDIAPYEVGACVQRKRLDSPLVAALWERIYTTNPAKQT